MQQKSFCGRFWHPIAKEFAFDKLNLTHDPVEDFFKSQWQKHNKSVWWLIYRWALAIFFTAGVSRSLATSFSAGKWFIYLTNWGFFLCMFTCVFGAILASIYYWSAPKVVIANWVVKFYWASHWSTLVLAAAITFIYWCFLFPDDASDVDISNLWGHVFNSLLMLLDHILVAFPTRILHFVYPCALGAIYLVFTVIYYFAGGLDPSGYTYIYPILDWSKPGWALLTAGGTFVLLLIFCFLFFGLYKLRCYIYRKCNNSVQTLNA